MRKLFSTKAILRECEKPEVGPSKVFNVEKRPGGDKIYTTGGGETTYRDMKAKVGSVYSGLEIFYESENYDTDYITITHGAVDPALQDDKLEKRKPKEVIIGTSVAKSGAFGKVLDIHDKEFNRIIESKSVDPKDPEYIKLYEAKTVRGQEVTTVVREISTGLKRHYSSREKVPENMRGQPRPDPKIELVIDFDVWPKSFTGAGGKPKIDIYDYKKPIPDTKPQKYEKATAIDGSPIDEKNAYQYLTRNSRIYRIIDDKKSVSISNGYVSNKNFIREMLVEFSPEETTLVVGEDGETTEMVSYNDNNNDNNNATLNQVFAPSNDAPNDAPGDNPEVVANANSDANAIANNDAINNFLSTLS